MSERIKVLGIEINNYTAKEAMQQVVERMKKDSLQVIARVTPKSIERLKDYPEYLSQVETYEIVFLGKSVLLETAGVEDKQLQKEVENQTFLKLFVRYLHKNQKKVFLLAETNAQLQKIQEVGMAKFPKITLVGTSTFEEHGDSEDMIVNSVNSVDADCIIAVLSSPLQEKFIGKYRAALNAKVWLGVGVEFGKKNTDTPFGKIKDFLEKQLLKKEI